MFGVHEELEPTFTDAEWNRMLSKGHGALDVHGTYRKPNGDRMTLPMRSHMLYAGVKGWTLVAVQDVESIRYQLNA